MFIIAIDESTFIVSGSCVTAIIESSACTVACRFVVEDGPTSTATSNSASDRSLSYSSSPVSGLITGVMSSISSCSPLDVTTFILRLSSTNTSLAMDSQISPTRLMALAMLET